MKLENTFRTYLTKTLKSYYGDSLFIQKNHGSMFSAGLPDLVMCYQGRVAFLELKACEETFPWRQLTDLQVNTLRQLHAAEVCAGVIVYFRKPNICAFVDYLRATVLQAAKVSTTVSDIIDLDCPVIPKNDILISLMPAIRLS